MLERSCYTDTIRVRAAAGFAAGAGALVLVAGLVAEGRLRGEDGPPGAAAMAKAAVEGPTASPATTAVPAPRICEETAVEPPPGPQPFGPSGAVREDLLHWFPNEFGGFYTGADGGNVVRYVGSPAAMEAHLRDRGALLGVRFEEAPVTIAHLRRCKVELEQLRRLAPGMVVDAVGISDSDSALVVSVDGRLAEAEGVLRALLGPDQPFHLYGALLEQ